MLKLGRGGGGEEGAPPSVYIPGNPKSVNVSSSI